MLIESLMSAGDLATLTAGGPPPPDGDPHDPGGPATLTAGAAPPAGVPRRVTAPGDLATLTGSAPLPSAAALDMADHAPPALAMTPGLDARSAVEIPPSLYGRFEAFELIGRGGMGAVYKARDFRLGRTVAIKLLFGQDPEGGLLREARSQARLRHVHVCEVYEAGVADQVPFIVMRFVDGAPLSRARDEMTVEEKVRALRDIALALHEAHRSGIVHRDVKPGNILLERAEDGTWKPFIADFGIARDLAHGEATLAHGVQGTPSFMAPEQAGARGGWIDRRTDVYGLGSTLYDTLAGRPPFTGSTLMELLDLVREAEPTPIRAVAPAIPLDLEAIVMKCLEKDPAARYDSAKALGEDLHAFLDGDPVAARRPSAGARLWKRARKHKARVAAALAAVLAVLAFAALRVRDLRVADERAALSRELGGSVREMELFLRSAHSMPLHDVERERDVVRAELREIEARMAAAGPVADGPGHDALGRGHLALQEARAALEHFRRARESGYDAPGLEYAMGLARIELYREALEKVKRLHKATEREEYIAAMEREHRAPALLHLRAALAQGVQSPAYAHGLIALHEGRLEDALARAEEAFAAAPWLYEAKKLEGDVLFAMGNRSGHDKELDHARASAHFSRAAESYRAAADLARSDPSVHESECELWIKAMHVTAEHGDSMRPGFQRAKGACERAIAASPRRSSSHLKLAWAHQSFAFWIIGGTNDGEPPERALQEAVERVEAAARTSPGDAFTHYLIGAVWRARALYAQQLQEDDGDALDRAVAGYDAALALDPGFLWAQNELCHTLAMRGDREARRGGDPGATFERAISLCRRALELDPEFLFPKNNIIMVHAFEAERLAALGLAPGKAVLAGLAAAAAAAEKHASWRWLPYWRARLLRNEAEYIFEKGDDPGPALARAEAYALELAPFRDSFADGAAAEGEVLAVKAEVLLEHMESAGTSPTSSPALEQTLSRARSALAAARAQAPWDLEYATWLARVELSELRYRLLLGRATDAHAEAPLAPIQPFLGGRRVAPRLFETAARVHEARAERLSRSGGDAETEIARGIALAEKAVASGPGLPAGRAALGRLLWLRARHERDPARKKEHARRAAEALRAAAKDNGLLGRRYAGLLAEVAALAEER